jgi:hypothetical protein
MFVANRPNPVIKVTEPKDKIPAVFFRITGGEGKADEAKGLYRSWLEVTQALIRYSYHGPSIGVDKVDFEICFEDGEQYIGTMEVGRTTHPNNDVDVAQHVYQHLRFYGGLITKSEILTDYPHLTWEQYQQSLSWGGTHATAETAKFLDTYDIPPHSFTEHPELRPATKICRVCGNNYTPYKNIEWTDLGRCGRCQQEEDERVAREEKRRKEQAEKEADPLYPTLQAGQQAVHKAIAKMLRERSGKAWSVKGGRGTGSSWSTISAPPRRLSDVGGMSPEDQRELSDLLGASDLVHKQGQSMSYGERWHFLKAARGDFQPTWETHYYNRMTSEHINYILNSLSEAPKTAQELINGYDRHASPGLDHWNIHNHLFILETRDEIEAGENGQWKIKHD